MSDDGTNPTPDSIRFERLLPGPIERVWRYLTESDARGSWLAEGEMELSPGSPFTLYFFHDRLSPVKEPIPEKYRMEFEGGCTLKCQVTHVDPPHRLSFTWGGESEVSFELLPKGDKVLLVLTHRLLDPDQMVSVAAGWHTHLDILVDHAEGRDPQPFWSTHALHEERYSGRTVAPDR